MKRNAFFQLIQRPGGTYLKSYPASDGGAALTVEDIMSYLTAKHLAEDLPLEQIKKFVSDAQKEKNAQVRIGKKMDFPEKEYAVVTVDKNRLYAKLRLYPNSVGGDRLTTDDIMDLLAQKGVTYGILDKNIQMMLKARLYCTDILVAKAKMPVHGHDAEIEYKFDVQKTSKPAVGEDGTVDFHRLDMIESVKEGQLLAVLIPADFGTPGKDVLGTEIRPKKVAVKKLKHGKNIHLSEDSLEMYSDVSGNVTCVDGTVFVSDCYEVPSDVGPSTGDIDYDGSVNVKGNVLTGYSVTASGDIYVSGDVEGANLSAGGKIVLNRGIQGRGNGNMEAAGDVISNFIESCHVTAGGKVVTDAIMHSYVSAKEEIEVNGKRGLIVGGSIRSSVKIEAKTIGSTMGTQTNLEVGVDPLLVDRYHEIEKETEKLSDEKERVVQDINILTKRYKATGSLEPDKKIKLKELSDRMEEIDRTVEELSEEYEQLDEELGESSDGGKIIAYDIAYSGVKLTISNITNYLHSEVQHSTFVRDGADIRVRGI